MVWTQIRTDNLSVLIWFQTVCKGYQQTTKFADNKEMINCLFNFREGGIDRLVRLYKNAVRRTGVSYYGLALKCYTVKPVLSGHSKRRQELVFKTEYC